jgi:hypothetical protein
VTDAVLALILIAALFAAVAAVRFFRTLDALFWRDAATPIITGLIAGAFFFFVTDHYVAIGIVLTLAALYVRLTGSESEPGDGMLLGSLTGAAAALPLVFDDHEQCLRFAECVLAGAISGYGVTFAAFYVSRRGRQIAIDAVTALAAIGGALLPRFVRLPDRNIAITTTILIPVLGLIALLKQWRDVTRELTEEANLGFIDSDDVRIAAHPIRRLGAAGWADPRARREFVRIANMIALRKRQQRDRPEDEVRLYQVEIIKLRMQLQEMSRIDQEVRSSSDTIASRE